MRAVGVNFGGPFPKPGSPGKGLWNIHILQTNFSDV
jgi:hypothetical protein